MVALGPAGTNITSSHRPPAATTGEGRDQSSHHHPPPPPPQQPGEEAELRSADGLLDLQGLARPPLALCGLIGKFAWTTVRSHPAKLELN